MGALPVGGFFPIPLAMMIPFMATQSIVMGEAFGKAYQFGKRKISAMTNEEFNRLTMSDLISESTSEFKQAIPKLSQSIDDSMALQNKIIQHLIEVIPQASSNLVKEYGDTNNDGRLDGYQDVVDAVKSYLNEFDLTPAAYAEYQEFQKKTKNLQGPIDARSLLPSLTQFLQDKKDKNHKEKIMRHNALVAINNYKKDLAKRQLTKAKTAELLKYNTNFKANQQAKIKQGGTGFLHNSDKNSQRKYQSINKLASMPQEEYNKLRIAQDKQSIIRRTKTLRTASPAIRRINLRAITKAQLRIKKGYYKKPNYINY